MTYIKTVHGDRFDFNEESTWSACFTPEIIAYSLAGIIRYTGHHRTRLTVAEHSVAVALRLREYGHTSGTQLFGLYHDGSEAFLGDVSSPLKGLPCMEGYRLLEDQVQRELYFSLLGGLPTTEQSRVIHACDKVEYEKEKTRYVAQSPEVAYKEFMALSAQLFKETGLVTT